MSKTEEQQLRDKLKQEWAESAYLRQSYNFDFEELVRRRLEQQRSSS